MTKTPAKGNKQAANTPEEIPTVHWADHAAENLIEQHPGKESFVCASGISPSGVIHIGNFREVITVTFVVQALRERGKKVRFIYSWDDYDALRKVPKSLPNQALIEENLRKPLGKAPDPFGQGGSYAAHFESVFEKSLEAVEIAPEYLRQNECYRRGDYAQGVKDAIKHQADIVAILNEFRTEPLPADWTCVSIFCKVCDRDTTEIKSQSVDGKFAYFCHHCKKDFTTSVDEPESGVKLLWRVDWPMRWAKEQVDFEPGGKDHSSRGGSFETGSHIIRKVWKREPPYYVQYDFVVAKGLGSKLSSSSGEAGAGTLITLDDALKIYEPSVLRWIFASRKPNIDFSIAFDLDVLKAYDDFDRTTRIALGTEAAEEKKVRYEQRVYEFSRISHYPSVKEGGAAFFSAPFRHLCNVLQIYQGDLDRTIAYFKPQMKDPLKDLVRFNERAVRAWTWVTQFAPAEFQFQVRDENSVSTKTKFPDAVRDLISLLAKPDFSRLDEEKLGSEIYQIMKARGVEPKVFFQEVYQILIGKNNGPRLASFLLALGAPQCTRLLEKSL